MASRPPASLFVALACLLCAGCGKTIRVNGIEVYQEEWEEAVADLRPRVHEELGCSVKDTRFELMKRRDRYPTKIMAFGCGKVARYSRRVAPFLKGKWRFEFLGLHGAQPATAQPATTQPAPAQPAPAQPALAQPVQPLSNAPSSSN